MDEYSITREELEYLAFMKPKYIDLKSISDVHKFYNCDKPKHPLITIIDLTKVNPERSDKDVLYRTGTKLFKTKTGVSPKEFRNLN